MFNNELWQKPAASGGGNFYDYQIPNSVRMNKVSDNNGANFSKTFSGSPTSTKKGTFSTWLKRASVPSNETHAILVTGAGGGSSEQDIKFENNKLRLSGYSPSMDLTTTQLFRDTSAWYHIVVAWDTTQGTSTNRVKAYVNGEQITSFSTSTYPSQDQVILWYSNTENRIGLQSWNDNNVYNGYMAETIGIDGTTYAASDFGETKNGVWIPKDASGLTFGNNGFYLNYASSGDLGNDVSGNNNDWTENNLAASDQTLDSPTNNFPTFNPLTFNAVAELTPSEGNCMVKGSDAVAKSGNPEQGQLCNMGVKNGKWYWEVKLSGGGATTSDRGWSIGISSTSDVNLSMVPSGGPRAGRYDNGYAYSGYSGTGIYHNNSITSYGSAPANNDIIGMALDLSTPGSGSLTIYKNGSSLGVAVNGSIADAQWIPYVGLQGGGVSSYDATVNFGQDGTFAGLETAQGNSDENNHGNFYHSVPSGHLAMCSANLPIEDAVDPAQTDDDYPQKLFTSLAYTGGTTGHVTGFKPDWVWVKARSTGQSHGLFDSTRGTTKILNSDATNAEATSSGLTAFNTDGYDMGTYYNQGANTYASWSWRANGGTTSTNTQGSVNSTVQTDPSGAFSIVTWAGGGGNATIGHGLSGSPTFMVAKSRTTGAPVMDWPAFHKNMNNGAYPANESRMYWDSTGDYGTGALWQNDNNSSTVFGVTYNINDSGKNYVAYCFTDVEGYCKADYYVGNGSTDNAFVYLGFRPAWIMIKGLASGSGWNLHDNACSPINVASTALQVNTASAELSNYNIDMVSNGFKIRDADGDLGTNGNKYIYLAMAHNPFKYATAR